MIIKNITNKQILILGLGTEGLSSYQFFRKLYPKKTIGLADQNPQDKLIPEFQKIIAGDPRLALHLGNNYLNNISDYDLIIKTPGIPFRQEMEPVREKITSQTKLFFDLCPAKIIGITGTKGKGTTSSLLFNIMETAGKKVYLAGNIGTPVLSLLNKINKEDLVILELSSHQLEDLDKSPQIAVFLNLFTEHLDHFPDYKSYGQAKANITKYQTDEDWFIYNADDEFAESLARKTKAQKISYSLKKLNTDWFVKNNWIYHHNEKIIPAHPEPLIGYFNLQNIIAASAIAMIFGISNQMISRGLKTYQPLPHRLEPAGTFKGITFYNDSQGTNPKAVLAALDSLKNVTTLICGGWDRGGVSYEEMGQRISQTPSIKTLIFFPPTGELIWNSVKATLKSLNIRTSPKSFFVKDMQTAVKLAYEHSPKDSVCLLSPGSASFGIFKNYADRGDQFKEWVKKLGK